MVHDFDDSYICQGTALAQLGISSFLFAGNRVLMKQYSLSRRKLILRNDCFDFFTLFLIWLYALVILSLSDFNYDSYNEILGSSLTLVSFVHVLVVITMIYRLSLYRGKRYPVWYILKKEWLFGLGLLVAVLGLMKIGDRGPIIQLFLAIFTAYYFLIGRVSLKHMCIVVIIGLVSMVYIRDNRIDGQYQRAMEYREQKYDATLPFYIEALTDLISNARCMYVGLEYVDKEGFLYGKSFVKPVLSPIPFLPTVATQFFFDVAPSELSTGTILTNETEDLMGRELEGVGTNNVVDIYMNIGVLGVCVLMGIFGAFVSYLEVKKNDNFYYFFCYCIIMSFAIYIPRSTIFDFLRPILWGTLLIYIRNLFPNRFKHYEIVTYK